MAGENSAIWRTTTSAASEASAADADKILFNESPVVVTGNYIMMTEANWRISVPENERIAGQVNNVQDMGLDGLDMQVTGKFKDSKTTASTNSIVKLVNWMREAKKKNTAFKKGRFGLRLDDMPQYNVVPTSTFGYVLANIKTLRDPDNINVANFVLSLRFSGDPVGIGA